MYGHRYSPIIYGPDGVAKNIQGGIDSGHKTQVRFLTADITSDTTISDLTLGNLTVGNWYHITGQFLFITTSSNTENVTVRGNHDSTILGNASVNFAIAGGTGSATASLDFVFQATTTTVTFTSVSVGASDSILGDGSYNESWVRITEINPLTTTTDFTP